MTADDGPRLLIVATDALGWRSQRDALLAQLELTAPQIRVRTVSYRPPAPVRVLLKDVYARYRRRRLGLMSSMVCARYAFSRTLVGELRSFAPDAALFLGHFPAAALPPGPLPLRTGMIADVTVPVARRLFRPTQLTPADETDERRLAHRMDLIFGNSQGVADSFHRDHGVDAARIRLCRPFAQLAQRAVAHGPRSEKPTVGFVGNDMARKGCDLLLRAFAAGVHEHADLVLVGQGTEAVPPRPGVTALGPVPYRTLIDEVMPRFDIFCLPTREDLSPLVLAEAASLGIPCVSTDVGFIREVVLHEETGLVVPVDDAEALAAAIARLAADPALRTAYGAAAMVHVRREFTLADNVASMLDALLPAWAGRVVH